MKGLCKEDKGDGRWETVEAFGGYLRSPQTEKYILCYKAKPHTHVLLFLSLLHTLRHMMQDADPQTL